MPDYRQDKSIDHLDPNRPRIKYSAYNPARKLLYTVIASTRPQPEPHVIVITPKPIADDTN